MVGGLEDLLAYRCLRHHGLDETAAVSEDQEMDLAARAPVVEPPFDGDVLAFVRADVFNVNVSHYPRPSALSHQPSAISHQTFHPLPCLFRARQRLFR